MRGSGPSVTIDVVADPPIAWLERDKTKVEHVAQAMLDTAAVEFGIHATFHD